MRKLLILLITSLGFGGPDIEWIQYINNDDEYSAGGNESSFEELKDNFTLRLVNNNRVDVAIKEDDIQMIKTEVKNVKERLSDD